MIALRLLCLLPLSLAGPLQAQETQPPTPPAHAQEKLRQWIQAKKTRSEEQAAWKEDQQRMRDLLTLRRQEVEQLDAVIEAAGNRLTDAEAQRKSLLEEEAQLRKDRVLLQDRIQRLESRALKLIPSFPPALRTKLEDAIGRLEQQDETLPLQNRYRDALAILIEAASFHSRITVATEMRQVEEHRVEFQVLYLGLGQAYYVDRSGRSAGRGFPKDQGWTWIEEPSLAANVRKAIEVHQKESPPELVRLPIEIQ